MSGPFGSSQWMYSSGPEFDNWGGTVLSLTRGTGGEQGGVYNLSNPSSVSYSTTGGGMYVVGLHQRVTRWIGITNGTSIQGQNGTLYSSGMIASWVSYTSGGALGSLSYRVTGGSFVYTAGQYNYTTTIPYVVMDMTGDSGYDNQIRLYDGGDTLVATYNHTGNTTWSVRTCAFDGGNPTAWDMEPIGQANYPF